MSNVISLTPKKPYKIVKINAKTYKVTGRVPVAVLNDLINRGFRVIFA